MAFIRHNVNMYLLFLVLFAATSLVGSAVFFQQKFDGMVAAYDGQIDRMNGLASELSLKQAALVDAEQDLKLRQAREEKLNQINERLASSVNGQSLESPTGAVVKASNNGVTQLPSTIVGTGFSARPRRGGYAFITA